MKQTVLLAAFCVLPIMLYGAAEAIASAINDDIAFDDALPTLPKDQASSPTDPVPAEPVAAQAPAVDPSPAPTAVASTPSSGDTAWTGETTQGITNHAEKSGRTNYVIRNKLLKKALELTAIVRELMGGLDKHFEELQTQARAALEKVATFRSENSLALGKIEGTIQTLTTQVESARAGGQLSEQERKVHKDLEAQLQEVEQLKKHRDHFVELSGLIDQMVQRLVEQVSRARQLGVQAEELNDKISNEFSDRAVQRMCDEMEAAIANIKQIDGYISNGLKKFLDEVKQQVEKQTDVITAAIEQLRKKGIDLTKEVQDADREDQARRLAKAKDSNKAPKIEQVSWLDTMTDWAVTAWEYIQAPFVWLYNWIMEWFESTPKKAPAVTKDEVKTPVTPAVVAPPAPVAVAEAPVVPALELPAITMPALPTAPALAAESKAPVSEPKATQPVVAEKPEPDSEVLEPEPLQAMKLALAEPSPEPAPVVLEPTKDLEMAESMK